MQKRMESFLQLFPVLSLFFQLSLSSVLQHQWRISKTQRETLEVLERKFWVQFGKKSIFSGLVLFGVKWAARRGASTVHLSYLLLCLRVAQPPTVVCKMEAQLEYTAYTMHTHFCTFGADLYVQSVLINKISALELSRCLLRLHCWLGRFSLVQSGPSSLEGRIFQCATSNWED